MIYILYNAYKKLTNGVLAKSKRKIGQIFIVRFLMKSVSLFYCTVICILLCYNQSSELIAYAYFCYLL